eukprot:scaffold20069_cov49-Phaeocystis_antarctica.AAC.1
MQVPCNTCLGGGGADTEKPAALQPKDRETPSDGWGLNFTTLRQLGSRWLVGERAKGDDNRIARLPGMTTCIPTMSNSN